MNLNNRALALRFAREAGINEPSSQKLQRFLELCAEHFINVGSEMMRDRCLDEINYHREIRSIPAVTINDLK